MIPLGAGPEASLKRTYAETCRPQVNRLKQKMRSKPSYMVLTFFLKGVWVSVVVFLLILIFLITWALILGVIAALHALYVIGLMISNFAYAIFSQGVFLPWGETLHLTYLKFLAALALDLYPNDILWLGWKKADGTHWLTLVQGLNASRIIDLEGIEITWVSPEKPPGVKIGFLEVMAVKYVVSQRPKI